MKEEELRRLSDCEILINKYHSVIQNFMKHSENFSKDVAYKKDVADSLFLMKKEMLSELEKMKEKYSKSDSRISQNEKSLDANSQLTNNLNDFSRIMKNDINNLFSHFDFLKVKCENTDRKIDSVNSKLPNKDKIHNEFQDIKDMFAATFQDFDKEQNMIRNKVSIQQNDQNLIQSQMVSNHDLNQKLHADSKAHIDHIKGLLGEMKSSHQSMMNEMKLHLDNRLNNLPKPDQQSLPDFKSMFSDMKKEILDQLEKESQKYMKALDISLLNEIQMKVMDKKLNNILEVLQKNKLS